MLSGCIIKLMRLVIKFIFEHIHKMQIMVVDASVLAYSFPISKFTMSSEKNFSAI